MHKNLWDAARQFQKESLQLQVLTLTNSKQRQKPRRSKLNNIMTHQDLTKGSPQAPTHSQKRTLKVVGDINKE